MVVAHPLALVPFSHAPPPPLRKFGEIVSARAMQDDDGKCRSDRFTRAQKHAQTHALASLALDVRRGFGFVCFKSPLSAQTAIQGMDGKMVRHPLPPLPYHHAAPRGPTR